MRASDVKFSGGSNLGLGAADDVQSVLSLVAARRSMLVGAGAPTTDDGRDGDFYLDMTSSPRQVYGPKVAGAWPAGVTL